MFSALPFKTCGIIYMHSLSICKLTREYFSSMHHHHHHKDLFETSIKKVFKSNRTTWNKKWICLWWSGSCCTYTWATFVMYFRNVIMQCKTKTIECYELNSCMSCIWYKWSCKVKSLIKSQMLLDIWDIHIHTK